MKHLTRLLLLTTACSVFVAGASAQTFSSGTTNTTNYLGYNTNNSLTDPGYNWSNFSALTGSGFTASGSMATTPIGTGGVWGGPLAGSSWVSFANTAPNSGNYPANGTYVFSADFTDPTPSGATDTITVMADDTVAVYLNGTLISGTPAAPVAGAHCTTTAPNCTVTMDTLTLPDSELLAGTNVLTFGVEQLFDNAMGLDYVVSVTDARSTPPATPEPNSLILLGTGLLGAAGILRRRIRA